MPVISQPHAVGTAASEEQIEKHLQMLGFIEVFETGKGMSKAHRLAMEAGLRTPELALPRRAGFLLRSEWLWLEDVHEENAVMSSGGVLQIFDPVLHFIDPI